MDPSASLDDRLLRLDPADDCVVARVPLRAGDRVVIDGAAVSLAAALGVGHKLAARNLEPGATVRKSGAVIGRTTEAVRLGDHLHLHNLRSDYLPAHLVGGEVAETAGGADPDAAGARVERAVEAGGAASGRPRHNGLGLPRRRESRAGAGAERGAETRIAPPTTFLGYRRDDGRHGIRNVVLVVYTVECAHHVARRIADAFAADDAPSQVQVVGFPGCYPNEYAQRVLEALCTHPNVAGSILVSLGCESFDSPALASSITASGRFVERLIIQEDGGTSSTIRRGRELVEEALAVAALAERVPMSIGDLVVGTICGGSDSTSLLTANPAVGRAFDRLVADGASCIFEETGELIGCEEHLRERGATPELGEALAACVTKAAVYYEQLGHASIAPGNLAGGLTTIEEKSIGAYAKSGSSTIQGIIDPSERPGGPGLYLLDVVPDGPARYGYPNIADTAEIVELIACGSHVILFTTGRGSVVGSVISPVVKVCANPDTYDKLAEDMDVDAGRILRNQATLDEVGLEIYDAVARTAGGEPTRSEALGHQEYLLGYKVFRSLEPSCLA